MPSKPLLIVLAALVLTNLATGWVAQHAIKQRGRAEAEKAVATARAEQYKAAAEAAERAALVAQQAARQAEADRISAHKRLAELERAQPDVKAWSDAPIPVAALECLRDNNCH